MLGPALHFEAPVSVFRVHLHLGAGWGTEPSAVGDAKLTSVVASAALLFGGQSRALSLYAGPFGGLQWTRVEGVPFDASAVQGDVVRDSSPLFGARAAFRARLASALQLEVGVDVGSLAGGVARFTADASTMRVASVSGVFIDASFGLALEL